MASTPKSSSRQTALGRPNSLEIGPCYHCESKARTNSFCQTWRIWSCTACLISLHRTSHESCKVDIDKVAQDKPRSSFFLVHLTRYDGLYFPLRCRLGDKLDMEEHWMGTYVFGGNRILLVSESPREINDKILEGLKNIR